MSVNGVENPSALPDIVWVVHYRPTLVPTAINVNYSWIFNNFSRGKIEKFSARRRRLSLKNFLIICKYSEQRDKESERVKEIDETGVN